MHFQPQTTSCLSLICWDWRCTTILSFKSEVAKNVPEHKRWGWCHSGHADSVQSPGNQVLLTIPVSSCSWERSFSALRQLQTWLRRTTGQSRLGHRAACTREHTFSKGRCTATCAHAWRGDQTGTALLRVRYGFTGEACTHFSFSLIF